MASRLSRGVHIAAWVNPGRATRGTLDGVWLRGAASRIAQAQYLACILHIVAMLTQSSEIDELAELVDCLADAVQLVVCACVQVREHPMPFGPWKASGSIDVVEPCPLGRPLMRLAWGEITQAQHKRELDVRDGLTAPSEGSAGTGAGGAVTVHPPPPQHMQMQPQQGGFYPPPQPGYPQQVSHTACARRGGAEGHVLHLGLEHHLAPPSGRCSGQRRVAGCVPRYGIGVLWDATSCLPACLPPGSSTRSPLSASSP